MSRPPLRCRSQRRRSWLQHDRDRARSPTGRFFSGFTARERLAAAMATEAASSMEADSANPSPPSPVYTCRSGPFAASPLEKGSRRRYNRIAAIRFIELGEADLVDGSIGLELQTSQFTGAHARGNIGKQQGVILNTGNRTRLLVTRLILNGQDGSRHSPSAARVTRRRFARNQPQAGHCRCTKMRWRRSAKAASHQRTPHRTHGPPPARQSKRPRGKPTRSPRDEICTYCGT